MSVKEAGETLHHSQQQELSMKLLVAIFVALLTVASTAAEAKHYRHHAGGACDGFQRCRCGTTAARLNGLSYDHNGMNLKKASSWYAFPHTSFRAGAVAVYPHHVATITGGASCSSATVHDDAGVYQRNVCSATFVVPGGGTGGLTTEVSAQPRQHHARARHRSDNQQVAFYSDPGWAAAH